MNKRELAQAISNGVNTRGFNRDHGIRFIDAFIDTIKDAIKESPAHGEFLIPGFCKIRWHRYRGEWIKPTPRVYIKVNMLTYQKNKFFDRCIKRIEREARNAPWFVGSEARNEIKGESNGTSSSSGVGRYRSS